MLVKRKLVTLLICLISLLSFICISYNTQPVFAVTSSSSSSSSSTSSSSTSSSSATSSSTASSSAASSSAATSSSSAVSSTSSSISSSASSLSSTSSMSSSQNASMSSVNSNNIGTSSSLASREANLNSTLSTLSSNKSAINANRSSLNGLSNSKLSQLNIMNNYYSNFNQPIYNMFSPNNYYFWCYYWIIFNNEQNYNHNQSDTLVASKNGLSNQEIKRKGKTYWIKVGDKSVNVPGSLYKKINKNDEVTYFSPTRLKVNKTIYTIK